MRAAAPPMASLKQSARARGLAPPSLPPPARHMHYAEPAPQRMRQAPPPWQQGREQPRVQHEPEPPLEPLIPPLKLNLPDSAMMVGEGFSKDGHAIIFDSRLSNITCCASYILSELLGVDDPKEEVEFKHDTDWTEFPEIGVAILQAGGEENSMCVALCPNLGVWGVGVGGKWQKREVIAKLALSASLIEGHENAAEILEKYPEFAEFCEVPQHRGRKRKAPAKQPAAPAQKKAKATPQIAEAQGASFPRDVPIWVKVEDEQPAELDGLLPEALVVSHDGTKRKALYGNIDSVLIELVGDPEADIEYHDDFNWSRFPAVGRALKEVSPHEECLCVAVCPSRSLWAVGVGMKGQPRYKAAKVAIAATLLWQASEDGEELPQLEQQAILDFVEEVKQAREEAGF